MSHVGVFAYQHLRPQTPTGDNDEDYPLCYPGAGYPDETARDRTIKIKKVDPRHLPASMRDPDGIRCGYVAGDMDYKVPGLGSPNAKESSSVYALDITTPANPRVKKIVKTGLLVGEREAGIKTYAGSHPNSVAAGARAIYVANGNNDSISVLQPGTYREMSRIPLAVLPGLDRRLKGTMPVAVRLSPDRQFLYVAEAGINAVAVIALHGYTGRLLGHIPVGWWPSSIQVSADGKALYVANARGRGAGPNNKDESTSPKFTTMGSVSLVPVPGRSGWKYILNVSSLTMGSSRPKSRVVAFPSLKRPGAPAPRSSTSSSSTRRMLPMTSSWAISRKPARGPQSMANRPIR